GYNTPYYSSGRRAEDILQHEVYFMGVALLSAQRSKDPNTQVGACIVDQKNNENKIVVATVTVLFPGYRATLCCTVCHAELNAILNSSPRSVKDCSMYVTLFPCNECAKLIIQTGECTPAQSPRVHPHTCSEPLGSPSHLQRAPGLILTPAPSPWVNPHTCSKPLG
uniref:dCMP deaminase n=1 Tax=Electrophorus electricus TaxID=8005 RepID=A0AAY5EAC0_ELEEL